MEQASPPHQVTELLVAWKKGDKRALDRLMPLVEAELRRLAKRYMHGEDKGHMLQTTALVNEAYLRLVDQRNVQWENRAQFYGIAAHLMRRVLIDHARAEHRAKRGGGVQRVPIEEAEGLQTETSEDLLALDDALKRLASIDQRKSKVVVLRYFGGLSIEEIANVLKVSQVTVMREWSMARAWLRREIDRAR
jgi:RNA polymerase sigma factor (TIGR02999 family)